MAIKLDRDVELQLVGSIMRYFREELDEEIGDLKAGEFLRFVIAEIAPSVYNQAIADAQSTLQDKVSELGEVRFEPEFAYWKKR